MQWIIGFTATSHFEKIVNEFVNDEKKFATFKQNKYYNSVIGQPSYMHVAKLLDDIRKENSDFIDLFYVIV